ncbi:MAG: hypothetical protein QNJ92_00190 [Alphaproteobacteria bacterium]|nr:hypothetical protein [Alphaproteobacteria bacterium]
MPKVNGAIVLSAGALLAAGALCGGCGVAAAVCVFGAVAAGACCAFASKALCGGGLCDGTSGTEARFGVSPSTSVPAERSPPPGQMLPEAQP